MTHTLLCGLFPDPLSFALPSRFCVCCAGCGVGHLRFQTTDEGAIKREASTPRHPLKITSTADFENAIPVDRVIGTQRKIYLGTNILLPRKMCTALSFGSDQRLEAAAQASRESILKADVIGARSGRKLEVESEAGLSRCTPHTTKAPRRR